MKIISTVTNDLTYDQRMIRICSSLAAAGYEVVLVGRKLPHSVPLQDRPFQQKRLKCYFHQGKLFYLEFNLRLLLYLLLQSFDVICPVDLDTILPGFIVHKLRGKRLVYDAHEYFTEVPEVVRRPGVQRVWEAVARLTIPNIRYAYTVGPALALLMGERYGIQFDVIRNVPVKQVSTTSRKLQKPAILLYQGVLNEGRGLEYLIDCMAQLDEAELWLAGEGDLSEQLRQQVAAAGLEEKVRFLGYVQPDQLKEITGQATLGFNLLENKGLSYYYSLANKAFDYIQAGLPSVQMDFPEYRSLEAKHGCFYLLRELNMSDLRSLIKVILDDKVLYSEKHQNCLKAAEVLNWEKEEVRLLEIYESIRNA